MKIPELILNNIHNERYSYRQGTIISSRGAKLIKKKRQLEPSSAQCTSAATRNKKNVKTFFLPRNVYRPHKQGWQHFVIDSVQMPARGSHYQQS